MTTLIFLQITNNLNFVNFFFGQENRVDDKVQSMVRRVQTGNINDLSDDQRAELKKRKLISEG